MPLAARHADAIRALDPPMYRELCRRLRPALPPKTKLSATNRESLVTLCAAPLMHPRDLAAPFFRETEELGLAVLEALLGHRITRALHPGGVQPRRTKAARRAARPVRVPRVGAISGYVSAKADMVVRLLVTDNPKRPGTSAHAKFAIYREGMTVANLAERGVRSATLRYDQKHGYISLEKKP